MCVPQGRQNQLGGSSIPCIELHGIDKLSGADCLKSEIEEREMRSSSPGPWAVGQLPRGRTSVDAAPEVLEGMQPRLSQGLPDDPGGLLVP